MITSTITVVLFTTVVRDLIPLRLKVLNFGLLSSTCHNFQFMLFKHGDFHYWVNVVKLLIDILYVDKRLDISSMKSASTQVMCHEFQLMN